MADGGEKDNGWQILEKQRWADSKEKDKGGQTLERWTKVGRRWRDGQRWADRGENKNRWGDRGRTVGSRPRVPVMISRGAKYRCLLYIRCKRGVEIYL